MVRGYVLTLLTALVAVLVTVSLVAFPEVAFESALYGLKIWWEVVFPALLPFFIGSQVLMGLGVVHFMGVLLEPFMRPVFNVPGAGSFVMAMGLASGYPIGSILTADLRRRNMCSKTEAERLMSFTNTADPLFMSGAVAVGMFGMAAVAPIIMIAHYLSSLSVGLVLRFYAPHEGARGTGGPEQSRAGSPNQRGGNLPQRTDNDLEQRGSRLREQRKAGLSAPGGRTREHRKRYHPGWERRESIIIRGLIALLEARKKDGRPLGRLLGDAITRSVETLMLIGGFIILVSVIIRVLKAVGVVDLIAAIFALFLRPLGLDPGLAPALVSGLFEITIGTKAASEAAAPLAQRVIAAGAVIAWSGMSVHGQVAAIIQGTDINMAPYIFSRGLHAFLAGLYTFLLLPFFGETLARAAMFLPVFRMAEPGMGVVSWVARLQYFGTSFIVLSLGLLLLPCALYGARHFKVIGFRHYRDR